MEINTLCVMVPATTFTVTDVGVVNVPLARLKLMPTGSPMVPAGGTILTTPGFVAVVVYVPEPDVALVAMSLQVVRMWFGAAALPPDGVTVRLVGVGGVGGGGASPAGPATPITDGDSITRLSASVTTSVLVPQPLCVTR